jgi:ribonuclease HI
MPSIESDGEVERSENSVVPIPEIVEFEPFESIQNPVYLFPTKQIIAAAGQRFVHRDNGCQMLIFIAGVAVTNIRGHHPDAGCAFVFGGYRQHGTISFRLENEGPTGAAQPPTENRAALRAVIAALQSRDWASEGFKEIVFATDNAIVPYDAGQLWRYKNSGWCHRRGTTWDTPREVHNIDLWKHLLKVANEMRNDLNIKFWYITVEGNTTALDAAHAAASLPDVQKFVEIPGSVHNHKERYAGTDAQLPL